ncbi:MAG: hypothetical protein KF774_12825 [Planctomyces sp.]|nr:hypothetical protein [Planctomyces sp.]
MSQLRLYAPALDEEHEPATLPFQPRIIPLRRLSQVSAVQRARLWQRNQACPCCHRITVEPVELEDALLDRKNEPIPGTATVVGFCCESCGTRWPAVYADAQ